MNLCDIGRRQLGPACHLVDVLAVVEHRDSDQPAFNRRVASLAFQIVEDPFESRAEVVERDREGIVENAKRCVGWNDVGYASNCGSIDRIYMCDNALAQLDADALAKPDCYSLVAERN